MVETFQLIQHLFSVYKGIVQVVYRFPDDYFIFQIVLNELLAN